MSTFTCFYCGRSTESHGLSMHRITPKGEKGLWACSVHYLEHKYPPVDPESQEIIALIEERNKGYEK